MRAVVFDVGGVLEIIGPPAVSRRWESVLGLEPGEFDRRLRDVWRAGSLGSISEAVVHRRIADAFGIDDGQVDAFMSEMWDEYCGRLDVVLARYFRGLRPRYRTAILSNSFVGAREQEQQRYGFEDMTDLIVYSHEVGMSKPDPRVYLLTCERLGVRPEETVFLDDVEESIEAARLLGIQAIIFRDTAQAIADIDAALAQNDG